MALQVGAQHAFLSRMGEWKGRFYEAEEMLNKQYDFGAIMRVAHHGDSSMYLLPAVIQKANDVTALSNDFKTIRISDIVWVIRKPERLVTRPPNWRAYLIYDDQIEPTNPPAEVLPETPEEIGLWKEWVSEGWARGILQADQEVADRIRALSEDYLGMIRYVRLAYEGKIDTPFISREYADVVGGGDEMRERETIFTLTKPVRLNPNMETWQPLILDDRGSLRYPDEFPEAKAEGDKNGRK